MSVLSRFVTLSLQRCGSTLLMASLRAHPQIHAPVFEPFHPRNWRRDKQGKWVFHSFERPDSQPTVCSPDFQASASQIVSSFEQAAIAQGARAYGFKFLGYQISDSMGIPVSTVLPRLLHQSDIIYIRRRDLLRQRVSLTVARKTGRFNRKPDADPVAPVTFRWDADTVHKELTAASQLLYRLASLARLGRRVMFVDYEDLVTDYTGTLHEVCDFLGVDYFAPEEPPLAKFDPRETWEILENYDELEARREHSRKLWLHVMPRPAES